MSAELLDPWDRPATHEPPLTADEVEAIREEIKTHQHGDHALLPAVHQIGFDALVDIACGVGNPYMPSVQATQAVRRMLQRAKWGGPLESMPRGEVV